jgi:hypothetical protein
MFSRCLVGTRISVNALVGTLAVVSLTPVGASAAVTQLTQGRGISLSPNPITSTGTVSLAVPLAITQPLSGPVFSITNSSSGDAIDATGPVAVRAKVNGSGRFALVASGGDTGAGVEAFGGPTSGEGVYAVGRGANQGVIAYGGDKGGTGVAGIGSGGNAYGVSGKAAGTRSGVNGVGASGDGVDGTTAATDVFGVSGSNTCADPSCVDGPTVAQTAAGGHFTANQGNGIYANAQGRNGAYIENNNAGFYTLYAQSDVAGGFPFFAGGPGGSMSLDGNGNLTVTGNITAGGTITGAAPAARVSDASGRVLPGAVPASAAQAAAGTTAAENDFDGNVTTDARGYATVKLPSGFDARNTGPRYQLTAIGPRGWDAKLGVWNPEHDNQFVIRSDRPGVEVSWRVTATPRARGR